MRQSQPRWLTERKIARNGYAVLTASRHEWLTKNRRSAAASMSVGSISFWQQDQNFWAQGQKNDQTQSLSSAVIDQMFGATTTLSTGLASIANQTALNRVNSELSAAVQSALQGITGSSSPSASSASSSSSGAASSSSGASSTPTPPPNAPASGTGTAPLLTSTSLFTLGILKKGQITVTDGTNTTIYQSTGTDTVGDLINAINANRFGNANVAAGLNSSGQLVITSKNNTDTITIAGAYAPNVGFGGANDTFKPTAPASSTATNSSSPNSASSASSSSSSTGSSSGTNSSTGSSTSAASGIAENSAFALQSSGTAELLLAGSGIAGSIVNLLA